VAEPQLRLDKRTSVLLITDIQPDFLPGGPLAVPQGDQILQPVAQLLEAKLFDLVVAIQDWHPREHISFASNHPERKAFDRIELYGHEQTLWPDHCVQGTPGAGLHPAVPWTAVSAIIRKGTDTAVDSYSGFRNNWGPHGERTPTGLAGYLRDRGVEQTFVCGLARDFCVAWTARDALQQGFKTYLLWDLCRSIDSSKDEQLRRDLTAAGVVVVSLQALLGT